MANQINTRIALKIDSYANWTNLSVPGKGGNLVLAKGEIGLCEIPSNGPATTAPTVLFKVGDGTLPFHHNDPTKCLKWASALAADVYDWAKKPEAEFKTWVNSVVEHPATNVTVVDTDAGNFITEITANGDVITVHRGWATVDVDIEGDGVVTATKSGIEGDLEFTLAHAAKGPSNGFTGGATTATADAYGESVEIKVPKLTVDKYGHVNSASDVTYKVAIPAAPVVNDGKLTMKAGNGLSATQQTFTANDADNVTFEVSHGAKPASGTAHAATAGTGRTYVTKVDVDSYGHIAKVYTATESDQDLSGYKTKQTVSSETFTKAQVVDTISQNANGEITVTKRTLTAADLGLENALHFIGAYATAPTKAFAGTASERALANGDVYLNTATNKEYIYSNNSWVELGDEGSHALKTVTITANEGLTGGGDLSANRTIGIANGGVTEAKLADAVKTKLNKEWQPVGDYKVKQSSKGDTYTGATVISEWSQDANGELTIDTRDLTPADIGAQPAGNYKTKQNTYEKTLATDKVVEKISQNANGEITVTERYLNKLTDDRTTVGDIAGYVLVDGTDVKIEANTMSGKVDIGGGDINIHNTDNLAINITTLGTVTVEGETKIDLKTDNLVTTRGNKSYKVIDEEIFTETWFFNCGSATTVIDAFPAN